MDRPKNSVIKSKSSNSAITSKSEPRKDKKSRSNAEIQPLMLKKRGVYVENKATKLTVKPRASNNIPKKPTRPPPIPRPNKKRFLNSVLNILSKSTAGTQYPDVEDCSSSNRRCERIKFKSKKASDDENVTDANIQGTAKKRPKYRSKVLNDQKNDLDKLVILQSKKEIVQTPSNNSQRSNFKEPESVKWVNTKAELEKCIYDTNEGIAKHVLDGLKLKEMKAKLNEKDTRDIAKKDEKGLYNFFVDLLETTFNIYNVKPEYDGLPINSKTSSKIALEIDESVAKRLNIGEFETSDDVTQKPSKHFCCVPERDWFDSDILEYIQTQNKTSAGRSKCSPKSSKKLRTRSFNFSKPNYPLVKVKSLTPAKKNPTKKNTKKEFLDTIKEQLRMDTSTFEEPQNLFQALKLMATNKRKYQKSIHFEKKAAAASNNTECVFKRRQVISFSRKSSSKKLNCKPTSDVFRSMINNYSEKTSTLKKPFKSEPTTDESEHSLEVYGFDYDSIPDKNDCDRLKNIELMYHSSPTQSVQDFNVNEALLKYSESGTSSVQNYVNWNHGIQSVTKVMKQL